MKWADGTVSVKDRSTGGGVHDRWRLSGLESSVLAFFGICKGAPRSGCGAVGLSLEDMNSESARLKIVDDLRMYLARYLGWFHREQVTVDEAELVDGCLVVWVNTHEPPPPKTAQEQLAEIRRKLHDGAYSDSDEDGEGNIVEVFLISSLEADIDRLEELLNKT